MSEKKFHILTYHGWAFDHSLWQPLIKEIGPFSNFENADRGYFTNPVKANWPSDSQRERILIVHSYGLHWCPKKIIRKADHLVLISSFLNFHPAKKEEHKRSKLLLRKMQTQFVDSPKKVLEKFYENSFYPEKPTLEVPANLNHEILLSDLSDLDRDNRENADVFDLNSITIIHGAKDRIVNNEMARDMYKKLRLRSQYFEIKRGGHALPVTHSSKIFDILNSLFQFKSVAVS